MRWIGSQLLIANRSTSSQAVINRLTILIEFEAFLRTRSLKNTRAATYSTGGEMSGNRTMILCSSIAGQELRTQEEFARSTYLTFWCSYFLQTSRVLSVVYRSRVGSKRQGAICIPRSKLCSFAEN